MHRQNIQITPCGAAAGVEITGADVRELSAGDFADIEAAFDTYGVLVVRDQTIVPTDQLAFAKRFGDIEVNYNSGKYGLSEHPEIYLISNITEDGKAIGSRRAGENWHSDMIYSVKPPRATMLYALEVPELHGLTLGDTGFANAAAAWDALPTRMQQHIEGMHGIFDFTGRKRSEPPDAATIARYPPVQHPIVRTHPRTGRKSLYINRDDCTGIVGCPEAEARALIVALSDHVTRPEFIYRHQWRKGDIVMWDNCTVQHKAILDYDLPQRRLKHRLTIAGSVPV
ncbi:MAG: TauD/TfdA family dioxygenase [Gammaproteobacteria bacterium]|nr:TauD/TfdA family dioxygenase [Gammaproteobacteria bacterium]